MLHRIMLSLILERCLYAQIHSTDVVVEIRLLAHYNHYKERQGETCDQHICSKADLSFTNKRDVFLSRHFVLYCAHACMLTHK